MILLFFFTVFLPIVLWILYVRWEDSSEPEPGRLIRRCIYFAGAGILFAGAFEAFFFGLLNLPTEIPEHSYVTQTELLLVAITVFLAGPIEELIKYFILRSSVYHSHEFNQIFDGIVYGITVALGFSFVENIFYFFGLQETMATTPLILTVFMRGTFTTLLHVTSTGIIGYHLGKAKFSATNRSMIVIKGIVYASVLHGSFNFLLSGVVPYGSTLSIVLLLVSFFLFTRLWYKPEVRMVWKYTP